MRDYCYVVIDYNIDIPVDRGDPHRESPRGGVSLSWGATREEPVRSFSPSSSLVPTPKSASPSTPTSSSAPVAPKATTGRTSRYVPPRGGTPAVTRSQATRLNQTPPAHDIAHQMDYRGIFSSECTYVTKNLHENRLREGEKERIPTTFKEAVGLSKAAQWNEAQMRQC